jgi:hypothetical protein
LPAVPESPAAAVDEEENGEVLVPLREKKIELVLLWVGVLTVVIGDGLDRLDVETPADLDLLGILTQGKVRKDSRTRSEKRRATTLVMEKPQIGTFLIDSRRRTFKLTRAADQRNHGLNRL